ncbi:MAG: InlB B-repeat-containing protein [Clostridia bacterium]|nr:InlB B-repeat-containing protein [Clostridia bacterium]
MNKYINKSISIIMVIILVLSMCAVTLNVIDNRISAHADPAPYAVNYSFDGGDGSEDNPFLIANVDQLRLLSNILQGNCGKSEIMFPNQSFTTYNYVVSAHFKLINDISINEGLIDFITINDIGDIDITKSPTVWTPIGNEGTSPFKGSFDGNGKTINGVFVNLEANYVRNAGLFGKIENAHIYDLTIEDSYCSSKDYTGILVGYAVNSNIDNCYVNGYAVGKRRDGSSENYVGSIVGKLECGTITDCCADTMLCCFSPRTDAGGVVGQLNGSVINCYFNGRVVISNFSTVGGIAGQLADGSTVANSYANYTLVHRNELYTTADNYLVGGLAGVLVNTDSATLTHSYYNVVTVDENQEVYDCASYQRINTTDDVQPSQRNTSIGTLCDSYSASDASVNDDDNDTTEQVTLLQALNHYVSANSSDNLLPWTSDSADINDGYPVKQYTYTFNQNGHGAQTAPLGVARGQSFARPALIQVSGWSFDGWYLYDTEINNGHMTYKNVTLTAHWTQRAEQLIDGNYNFVFDNELGFDSNWTTDVLRLESSRIDTFNTIYFPAQIGSNATVFEAYHIGILDNTINVHDIGRITITIPLTDITRAIDSSRLGVVLIDNYNKATLANVQLVDDHIVLTTDTQSMPIVIGIVELKPISLWWIWVIVGVVVLAVAGVIVLVVLKKKNSIINEH